MGGLDRFLLVGQAFEEVDVPPLEDVWEAELEAISEFLEWEEM